MSKVFPRTFSSCKLNCYMPVFIFLQPKVSGLSDIIVSTSLCALSCLPLICIMVKCYCNVCINLLKFLAARPGSLSLLQLDPRLQDSCSRSWGLYMTYFFIFLALHQRYCGACLYFCSLGCLNCSWLGNSWVKFQFGCSFPCRNILSSFHLFTLTCIWLINSVTFKNPL